jgi:hypothetical protein
MKNKPILNKIAAGLAFVIGALAIFAGGRVLLGILPDYYVIDWLPLYNFILGITSAFFTTFLIWKNSRLALPASAVTFGLHAVVMLVLQIAYRQVVAPDSIMAMTVRMVIWVIILCLIFIQRRINKK